MREASLALGASQWQTIYKVVIPYSISGITSGVVLGIGRAVGETMAVLMVTGNAAVIPHSILEPLRTIPATIAAELGEAPAGWRALRGIVPLGSRIVFYQLVDKLHGRSCIFGQKKVKGYDKVENIFRKTSRSDCSVCLV